MQPIISTRKCLAAKDWCKAIPACPNAAIFHVVDASAPLGGKIMIDDAKCDASGFCVEECCGHAIDMAQEKYWHAWLVSVSTGGTSLINT